MAQINGLPDLSDTQNAQAVVLESATLGRRKRHTSVRERIFISKYLQCLNERQAAQEAGFQSGYGSVLLRRKHIRARVARYLDRTIMPANEVLARLSKQARADIVDTLGATGTLDLDAAREAGVTGEIVAIEFHEETGQPKKVKMADKQGALALLGKAHGIFRDEVRHTGQVDIQVTAAKESIRHAMGDPAALAALIAAADMVAATRPMADTTARVLPQGAADAPQ